MADVPCQSLVYSTKMAGDEALFIVSVGEATPVATMDAAFALPIGTAVDIAVDPTRIRLSDADGGARLRA